MRTDRERRYNTSAKGKARNARYEATARARARQQKYEAANPHRRRKRVYVGGQYYATVETPEHAALINTHIKGRVHAFKQGQQDRKKTQVVTSRRIPPEAAV